MMVPTLYVHHQVEQSRRLDERRAAGEWRLFRAFQKQQRAKKGERRPSSPASETQGPWPAPASSSAAQV
jgi:hypothetical protein